MNLTTLETRRLRGDLIEVFKIIRGFVDVNSNQFFTFSSNMLRGHQYKLFKKRFNTNVGKYSFSNRVVDIWNTLPCDVVASSTVVAFKSKIDQLFKDGWGLL